MEPYEVQIADTEPWRTIFFSDFLHDMADPVDRP